MGYAVTGLLSQLGPMGQAGFVSSSPGVSNTAAYTAQRAMPWWCACVRCAGSSAGTQGSRRVCLESGLSGAMPRMARSKSRVTGATWAEIQPQGISAAAKCESSFKKKKRKKPKEKKKRKKKEKERKRKKKKEKERKRKQKGKKVSDTTKEDKPPKRNPSSTTSTPCLNPPSQPDETRRRSLYHVSSKKAKSTEKKRGSETRSSTLHPQDPERNPEQQNGDAEQSTQKCLAQGRSTSKPPR